MFDPWDVNSSWRMGSESDISSDEECLERSTIEFPSRFKPIQSQAGFSSFITNDGFTSLPRPPRNCGQRSTNMRSLSFQENDVDIVVHDTGSFNDSVRSINASTSMNDLTTMNGSSSNSVGTATTPNTNNVGVSTSGGGNGTNPGPSTSSTDPINLDRPGCEIGGLSITEGSFYIPPIRFDDPGGSGSTGNFQGEDLTKRSVAKVIKSVIKRKNSKNLHDKKRLKWRDMYQPPIQSNSEIIVVDDMTTSQDTESSSKQADNIDVIADDSSPLDKHAELNRTLLKLLECPVCLEYMSPPIHHCKRGHLVCKNCKLRLDSCPYCRSRLCESRNLAMEQVAESLLYPCEFHNAGCKKQILLREKIAHENNCEFRIYNCFFDECHWKGQHNAMITHMNESHSSRVLNGNEHNLVISSYDIYSMNWLISVFAEVFHLNMTLKHTDFTMCVKYIGPVEKTSKYTYTINIDTDKPIKRQTSFTRQVHNCTEKINIIQAMDECFYLRSDAARLYMSEGNLNCNIQIKQL